MSTENEMTIPTNRDSAAWRKFLKPLIVALVVFLGAAGSYLKENLSTI